MDGKRFDTITRRLTSVASRRQVLGGLGIAATSALVGREAAVARPKNCNKECNDAAKEGRQKCKDEYQRGKGFNSRDKKACLKEVKEVREACLEDCPTDGN